MKKNDTAGRKIGRKISCLRMKSLLTIETGTCRAAIKRNGVLTANRRKTKLYCNFGTKLYPS